MLVVDVMLLLLIVFTFQLYWIVLVRFEIGELRVVNSMCICSIMRISLLEDW
ncbi:hypothetical protein Hanom_Chr12g01091201 [Helianthus anomalus]